MGDARALGADDHLGGASRGQEPPPTIAGEVMAEPGLPIVAFERNDLLDAHTAEHVENLVAHANRIYRI